MSLALGLSSFFSLPAAAAPIYEVVDLGFSAIDINDQGQIVGNAGQDVVLRSRSGNTQVIGTGRAIDINEFGQVLGEDDGMAWIWDPVLGRTSIGLQGATAFNDRNQVIGRGPEPFANAELLYVWDPVFGGRPLDTVPIGDVFPTPRDITNAGRIIGDAGGGEFSRAWVLDGETAMPLMGPDLLGAFVAQGNLVADVNEQGVTVGTSLLGGGLIESGNLAGFNCWDLGGCSLATVWTSALEPISLDVIGNALGVNDRGQVVGRGRIEDELGYCSDPPCGDRYDDYEFCSNLTCDFIDALTIGAFLWDASFGPVEINELVQWNDIDTAVFLSSAFGINQAGSILASAAGAVTTANRAGCQSGNYLLVHKVTEPPSLFLAISVLLLMGLWCGIGRHRER